MTVSGSLVTLRAREPSDAVLLSAWQSDAETMRWWDRVYPPLPAEALAARLETVAVTYESPWFTILAEGAPIGACGLYDVSAVHRHAMLSMLIGDAAYRGRGYGTDATRTLCRFAFGTMNLARVSLTVFPGNVAGRRAYERAGFAEEGVQRRAIWKRGEWHDLVHMSVSPSSLRL